jgi:hypothetical protein
MREELQPQVSRRLKEIQEQLSCEIQGLPALQEPDKFRDKLWDYVSQYLDDKIKSAHSLFTAASPKNLGEFNWSNPEHRIHAYKVVLSSAKHFATIEGLTLRELASRLECDGLLSYADSMVNIQLMFHVVGWLTTVWDPILTDVGGQTTGQALEQARSKLQIRNCKAPGHRRASWRDQPIIRTAEIPIDGPHHRKIHQLMSGHFGTLLPIPEHANSLLSRTPGEMEAGTEPVPLAYLSWQAVGYKIEWTSTLNQHLEMDRRHKILFVYQCPSLCWMLSRKGSINLLSRFVAEDRQERADRIDQANDRLAENAWAVRELAEHFKMEDFWPELFRTYRVVFAPNSLPYLLQSQPRPLELPELPGSGCDPLLELLCYKGQQDATHASLLRDFDLSDPEGSFVSLDEFDFFGKRLRQLAKAAQGQNPHRLWRLWIEKNNADGWTVKWVVFILATGALLLQLAQTVITGMQ